MAHPSERLTVDDLLGELERADPGAAEAVRSILTATEGMHIASSPEPAEGADSTSTDVSAMIDRLAQADPAAAARIRELLGRLED